MAVVGSAEVIVRAITTKVRADIEKAFKDAQPSIQAAGRDAAKNFSGAFNQTLEQRLGPVMESTFRKAAADAGEGALEEIGNRLSDLDAPAGEAGRRAGQSLRRGLSNGSNGNEFSGLLGALNTVANAGENLGSAMQNASTGLTTLIATGNFAGAAISGIAGAASVAVSGLFSMVAAASQAAGALAVLPGILSVLGQAAGVLGLAFGGIGAALKAGTAAQKAATSASTSGAKAAKDSAAQARAQQKAQDELTAAQKAATEAQKELNKAQKIAADGAEEQELAQTLLFKAQQNRNQTIADPNATAADGAAAQAAVSTAEQANQQIVRSREKALQNLQDAELKNQNAQDRVAKAKAAQQALQNKGGAAAAGAMTPAVKAANAYADALAKLSPQAQEFVKKLLSMKDTFHDIGLLVQEAFFKPINDGLDTLIRSDFFPILRKELPITGGILGQIGKQVLTTFSNTKNMDRFQKVLEGNNDILRVFKTRTSDGETPVQALVNLFMKLLQAIQPITKRFAEWTAQLITGWDVSKKFGSEKGMEKFFKGAGDMAAQLGRIIGNLLGAFGALGGASQEAGHGLWDSFETATQKFEDWSKKVSKDGSAKKYFDDVAENLRAIGDLINTIGGDFAGLADNPGIADLAKNLQPAVDNIFQIFDNFNANGDTIGKFADQASQLVLAFTDSNGINLFFETLTAILGVINDILGLPRVKQGLGLAAGFMAVSRAIKFASGLGGMFISDIVKNFKNSLKTINNVRNGFKNVGSSIHATITQAGGLGSALRHPIQSLKNLKDNLKAAFSGNTTPDTSDEQRQGKTAGEKFAEGLRDGIKGAEHLVIAEIDSLVHKLVLSAADAADEMVEVGGYMVEGLKRGINTNAHEAVTAINNLGDDVVDALKTRLGIHSPSVVFDKLGQNTGEGYVQGLRSEMDDAYKAGAALGDAAQDGARSQRIVPNVATTAAAPAAKAAANSVDLTPAVVGATSAGKAVDDVAKKSGKLSGVFGKVGGSIKGLSGGLMALTGGPFGLILTALPLVIAGFTALYKKSPEFRKFIDGIVKAVKPFVEAIGKWVLGVLNDFFAWINSKMPTIKKIVGDVFSAIGGFVKKYVVPAWNNILLPAIQKFWTVVQTVFPVVQRVFSILFEAIKFYITKIFIPYWKLIFSVIRNLLPIVSNVFGVVKSVISGVFSTIGFIWNKVLRPVFSAMGSAFRTIGNIVGAVFSGIRTVFDGFKTAFNGVWKFVSDLVGKITGAFSGIGQAIGDAFGKMGDFAKTGINTFIGFINDKLIGSINKLTSVFGLTIPPIKGFAEGGYTGPGSKYKAAGIVHADEFVINKSSRQKIERQYPGLLNTMNKTGQVNVGIGGGWGPIGDIASGIAGLAEHTWDGLKKVGSITVDGVQLIGDAAKYVAEKGVGQALYATIKGVQSLMGTIDGPGFVKMFEGVLDSMADAAKSWGGNAGKTGDGSVPGTGWRMPFDGKYPITQYPNQGHNPPWSVDFGVPLGTPIKAAASGSMKATSLGDRSYGNYVVINHADGVRSLYAHLSSFAKTIGEVASGETIGWSGSTGHSTGPHLHFEIMPGSDTLEELRKRGVKFAKGGVAKSTVGGILSVVAEAGSDERVEPLDENGLSKRDKQIMKLFQVAGGTTTKGNVSVTVNNPSPERASVSVAKVVKNKALQSGWGF